MLQALKNATRRALLNAGYDVHRAKPRTPTRMEIVCKDLEIDLAFDVGANIGQFAMALRRDGFRGTIVSFEAASSVWKTLTETASTDPRWTIAPRAAIGPREGEIELNVAGNQAASSSVLPMLDRHLEVAPQSAYVRTEKVVMRRLDDIGREYLGNPARRVLLKIDVQGYEAEVLEGASGLLDHVRALHLEMSLVPLYEGQKLFEETHRQIRGYGFHMYDIQPGFTDHRNHQLLQVNALFVRTRR
jgi:FkbM family methyltransferase